jgi:hypothetical protein
MATQQSPEMDNGIREAGMMLGKQAEIFKVLSHAAARLIDGIRTAFPKKRIFPIRDRLERLRRQKREYARMGMLIDCVMDTAQINRLVSQPIPKYPKGCNDAGISAIVGEGGPEIINHGERIFPVFPNQAIPLPQNSQIISEGIFEFTVPAGALMPRDKVQRN